MDFGACAFIRKGDVHHGRQLSPIGVFGDMRGLPFDWGPLTWLEDRARLASWLARNRLGATALAFCILLHGD